MLSRLPTHAGTAICCNKNDFKSSFDSEVILVHTVTRSLRQGCDWSSRLWSTVCSLLGSLDSMVAGLLASRARSWCLASLCWYPPKRKAHSTSSSKFVASLSLMGFWGFYAVFKTSLNYSCFFFNYACFQKSLDLFLKSHIYQQVNSQFNLCCRFWGQLIELEWRGRENFLHKQGKKLRCLFQLRAVGQNVF
jgi:hypothetical protein